MNDLPYIDDIEPIDRDDMACMRELRSVLEKHGKLKRFGVTLLHKHFDLEPTECLVETTHPHQRELTLKPEVQSTRDGVDIIETAWRLDSETAIMECVSMCRPVGSSGHRPTHWRR